MPVEDAEVGIEERLWEEWGEHFFLLERVDAYGGGIDTVAGHGSGAISRLPEESRRLAVSQINYFLEVLREYDPKYAVNGTDGHGPAVRHYIGENGELVPRRTIMDLMREVEGFEG